MIIKMLEWKYVYFFKDLTHCRQTNIFSQKTFGLSKSLLSFSANSDNSVNWKIQLFCRVLDSFATSLLSKLNWNLINAIKCKPIYTRTLCLSHLNQIPLLFTRTRVSFKCALIMWESITADEHKSAEGHGDDFPLISAFLTTNLY